MIANLHRESTPHHKPGDDSAMNFEQITSSRGEVGRKDFLIWGVGLFAVKYNFDRLLAMAMNRKWAIWEYFTQFDSLSGPYSEDDIWFYSLLLLLSIPFIWCGTLLTLKRLRDASLPLWLVLLFFLPFLNLLFFGILAAIPSRQAESGGEDRLARFVPRSRFGSAVLAIAVSCLLSLLLILLLIESMGEYGWSVFVGIPFLLGFCSVVIYGSGRTLRRADAISVSMSALTMFSTLLFLIAFEGLICLAMAFPIGLLISLLGALLGYAVHRRQPGSTMQVLVAPVLLVFLLGLGEHHSDKQPPMLQVVTTIEVDAPPQQVWDQLVAFSTISPPRDWLFKTGLAYPTHAEISGTGVGAVRKCHFTTGPFIEPITVWDEPHGLAFSVEQQPPPMVEMSLYDELHIAHLDGYFRSHRGAFDLSPLPGGRTLLRGTTWYTNDVWPLAYWQLWTDFILHRIHLRVLSHIKGEAEGEVELDF